MITVISGSNRRNSECLTFARFYYERLSALTDEPVKLLALEDIPHDWFHPDMYSSKKQSPSIVRIQDEYMLPATKFVFIIPEYNGSFPGALKLFIDAISVRHYSKTFKDKKAALVGIASGRAGNLRGMDHFTGVLHHVGTHVMPNKLPISRIETLTDDKGRIIDRDTLLVIEANVLEILAY